MLTNTAINDHMFLNSFCFAQRCSIKVIHEQSMWKHDSKKRMYGSMSHIQLCLLKLKSVYINVILNCNRWLLYDYLSNGKYTSTSMSLPFYVYVTSNLQKEHTQHKFKWRTAHFDHGLPSGVWFHWNVTHVHVARSSERLCNYIKGANSCSIKCTVHGTLQCRRKLGMHLHITEIMAAVQFTGWGTHKSILSLWLLLMP